MVKGLLIRSSCYIKTGSLENAQVDISRLLEMEPSDTHVLFNQACIDASQGNLSSALKILGVILEQSLEAICEEIKSNPALDNFRGDSAFIDLLESYYD